MKSLQSNSKNKKVDIDNLWLECAKRDLQVQPIIHTALQQLRIDPSNQRCLHLIVNSIQTYDIRETLHPDPFRKSNPKHSLPGDIRLGMISNSPSAYNIPTENLTVHMVIAGRTGGGKSSVIKLIIRQLLERNKS